MFLGSKQFLHKLFKDEAKEHKDDTSLILAKSLGKYKANVDKGHIQVDPKITESAKRRRATRAAPEGATVSDCAKKTEWWANLDSLI